MAAPVGRLGRGPGPGEAVGALGALLLAEAGLAATLSPGPGDGLAWTGAVRLGQIALLLAYWRARGWGWEDLGLRGPRAGRGLALGAGVAAAFGAAAGIAEAGGRLLGFGSFLGAVAGAAPSPAPLALLLAVGAVVGPAAEELAFRGLLYGGLRRRLSPLPATLAATALFAAAHGAAAPIPWVQAVGGLAFCAAYERSGSLWAPLVVHGAGNLALFLIPYALGGG